MKTELSQRIEAEREHMRPNWEDARENENWRAIQSGRERSSAKGPLLVLAACAVALLGLGQFWGSEPSPTMPATPANSAPSIATAPIQDIPTVPDPETETETEPAGSQLTLADGSSLRLAAGSTLRRLVDEDARIELELEGPASFDVRPDAGRPFIVRVGELELSVLGTRFEVRPSAETLYLSVSEGKVQVARKGIVIALVLAGESGDFAFEEAVVINEERPPKVPPSRSPEVNNWRDLARSGEHVAAFEALSRKDAKRPDTPEALMQAADAARLSGHPEQALPYLDRVSRDFAKHPLASLAAFTAGRTRLERLGQPRAAAKSFALARRLAPNGSMAEDALAREVEALSKSGDSAKASEQAQEYLHAYPSGRRMKSVKLYGGLD